MLPNNQISRKRKSDAENNADPLHTHFWPSRMGERLKDELTLYTEGYFYDCTFEVGCKMSTKVFKCHKVTLARASPVLGQMLYGNESNGKDDPIQLKHIQPEVFDLVMRYIYGGETDFKDMKTACKIYMISHEWLMNDLTKAAANFLQNPSPEDVITVHEFFKSMNDNSYCKALLQIVASKTSAVLKSNAWLKSSASTVLEIFQMDHLNVKYEMELFEALYLWGSAGGMKENGIEAEEIKAKTVKDALQLIRFMTMDVVEFGELCKSEGAKMLTEDEKVKVFMSISLADQKLLPENFASSRFYHKVDRNNVLLRTFVNTTDKIVHKQVLLNSKSKKSVFTFACKENSYYLGGVSLECLSHKSDVELICYVTCAHSPKILTSFHFKGEYAMYDYKWLTFPHEVHIKANVFYTISVEYLHKNPVKSSSSSHSCQTLQLTDNLQFFMPETNFSVADISGFLLYVSPE
ncbi:BTB/POZ domain-containing protein 3-like [Neocloeon triangulifer]|uniref:BTB/POZ domain-containing protein 3-like n=1 Tax=Neocloeon triangulifer TaxID=2078957 RepID=UPI00286F957F|nr:BTB/POZ domain-containing protein 3-like [Neocloeon triangulifer]